MHRKYGPQDVVCVSVSVDPEENRGAALGFLKDKQAAFPNFWLNEEQEVWRTVWRDLGPLHDRYACSAYLGCTFTEPHDPHVQTLSTGIIQALHTLAT